MRLNLLWRIAEGLLQFVLLMLVLITGSGTLLYYLAVWRERGERGYGF